MNICAVPRERVDFAVEHGKHLAPHYEAARDFACLHGMSWHHNPNYLASRMGVILPLNGTYRDKARDIA